MLKRKRKDWLETYIGVLKSVKKPKVLNKSIMFAMGMTKQRQADREKRVHRAAINRALIRQLQREEIKQGVNVAEENCENLTDDEDLSDIKSTNTETLFYDICDETEKKSNKNDSGKPEPTGLVEKKTKDPDAAKRKKKSKKSEKKGKSNTTKEVENNIQHEQILNDINNLNVDA